MKMKYSLRCLGCGKEIEDNGTVLTCDCNQNAFLRTEYAQKQLRVKDNSHGIYRFSDWMPVSRQLTGSSAPITYKSEKFAGELGLKNLFITFNGYWPERGIAMSTNTFKECEAYSVCARLPENFDKTLVVASAGNTARAFSRVCSDNDIPLVVVIPEQNLDAMWFTSPIEKNVRLIAAGGRSDYFDAIKLSGIISGMDGFVPEGGAKNVARRDGMGTTVLSAVSTIGEIPDYYFQAVGSGTGAIAAWEANLRFSADGQYPQKKMSLQVSQNAPFLLLHDSWKRGTRELVELDKEIADMQIEETVAKVLSNRRPPYSPIGGLYDALMDTGGDVIAADNNEAYRAGVMFMEAEGCDISPAASVAVASLIKKVNSGEIEPDAVVMLNITGGGFEIIRNSFELHYMEPDIVIPQDDIRDNNIEKIVSVTSKELDHGLVR
jgi:cysteate synthase